MRLGAVQLAAGVLLWPAAHTARLPHSACHPALQARHACFSCKPPAIHPSSALLPRRTQAYRALVSGFLAGPTLLLTGPKARHTSLAIYILLR